MTFTLTLPTWSSIKDMFLLIVLYYSALVAPQYDWVVFGFAYYLGILVALRSWWRLSFTKSQIFHKEDFDAMCFFSFLLCIAWPIAIPLAFSSWFVTFANKKGG